MDCGPARRGARHEKTITLALQGGGSHGAFTWGVLDRLLEDDRLWITAISGASAGAMNAVVAAQGMQEGGAEGARAALSRFWNAVADAAAGSVFQRSPWAVLAGDYTLNTSPAYVAFDLLSRLASPYDLNPLNLNPLRDLVSKLVDFERVRGCDAMQLFVAATNVETGRARIFHRGEMTLDMVMASACLPFLFQAVEIDGQHYWDGGYMGNPPLAPLLHGAGSDDVLIVQLNPVLRPGAPRRAQDILNRLNEITFNSALLHELRGVHVINRLLRQGALDHPRYAQKNIHLIHARKLMRTLDASSKLNAERAFILRLFEMGRLTAEDWLSRNYAMVGRASTLDLGALTAETERPSSAQAAE